jgi:hypothetical protein
MDSTLALLSINLIQVVVKKLLWAEKGNRFVVVVRTDCASHFSQAEAMNLLVSTYDEP